jgi:hypothetical protein
MGARAPGPHLGAFPLDGLQLCFRTKGVPVELG